MILREKYIDSTNPMIFFNDLESLSTGLPEQVHQVFVRASDTNIVCEVQPVPVNQPCNMLIKVIHLSLLN